MNKFNVRLLFCMWHCALIACGGDTTLSTCDIRESSCQLDVFLAVQDVRGSIWDAWLEPPPMEVISEAQYRAQVVAQREHISQQSGVDYLTEGLKLLTMVDPKETPDGATDFMVANVAAFYDAQTQTVTIIDRADAGDQRDAVRTLAHELVHAAQDRDVGFGRLYERVTSTDSSYAVSALVEGEAQMYATLVDAKQLDIPKGAIDWRIFDNWLTDLRIRTFVSLSPFRFATTQLPYPLGGSYSAAAYLAGGPLRVRSIYDMIPLSTVEFMGGEAAPGTSARDSWRCGPIPAPAGYDVRFADELGALALYSFVTRFSIEEVEAWERARLWTGDRFYVYSRADDAGSLVVVWVLRCVDSSTATSLQAALGDMAWPQPLQTVVRGDTLHLLATRTPLVESYEAWMHCDSL